jgi:hypothetical protein
MLFGASLRAPLGQKKPLTLRESVVTHLGGGPWALGRMAGAVLAAYVPAVWNLRFLLNHLSSRLCEDSSGSRPKHEGWMTRKRYLSRCHSSRAHQGGKVIVAVGP